MQPQSPGLHHFNHPMAETSRPQPTLDTPVEQMTYSECAAQLDSILRYMQSGNVDIDKLTKYTRRATLLLQSCRKRLTATETELTQMLETLK